MNEQPRRWLARIALEFEFQADSADEAMTTGANIAEAFARKKIKGAKVTARTGASIAELAAQPSDENTPA